MWTPDVYEGSPTPITAFFLHCAENGGDGAVPARDDRKRCPARSMNGARSSSSFPCSRCFLGSVAAIGQGNIKRLMAYSSIAHMGYALIGIAAGTFQGVQGVLVICSSM